MELYQLRGFIAVAELAHLTRAAEKLPISQPALSAQIMALEDELGVQLFERAPAGMMLTAAGKQASARGRQGAGRRRGTARKGPSDGGRGRGPRAGRHARRPGIHPARGFPDPGDERFPLLEIELHHEVSGAAFEKVRDAVLDASFYYGDLTHPAVASIPLREIAYRIAAPAAWRDRIAEANWADIAALPWLMAPAISTHHVLATRLFAERGSAPATLIEADNEMVIRSLVASGLGVALVREDLAQESAAAGELVVWSDVRLATTLQFIYSGEKREEPEMRALQDLITDVWREPAAAPTKERRARRRARATGG